MCCELKINFKVLLVTFFLQAFVFSTVVKPNPLNFNSVFLCYALYPHRQYFDLVTLLFQEKAVSIVTELINHNQPMFVPSSADLFEGTDINEYPVSWFGWHFHYFLLLYISSPDICFCTSFTWWQSSYQLEFHVVCCRFQKMFSCVSCH